jgi:hypothetical protein
VAICTLSTFKDYARNELGTADDTAIQAALDAAHSSAYQYVGRSLEVAGASSARTFVPIAYDLLRIDDCATITSVVNNGTTLTTADYQAEPVGNRNFSGAYQPIEQLRMINGGAWYIDSGKATVTVTAAWGWSAAPAAGVEAVKILAKDILMQRDTRNGVAGFGEFGSVRVRMNPYVAMLLDPLRRVASFGIG